MVTPITVYSYFSGFDIVSSNYRLNHAFVIHFGLIETHISIIPNLTRKEKIETTQTNQIISNKLLNLLDVHYSGIIQDI